ncbi:MAG: M48 family metallopeptidase [bacterium]
MMNIYTIVILSTLIFGYLLDLIANFLNLRALQFDLPEEFKDTYDKDAYRKSQEYTKTSTYFSLFTSTVMLGIILIFWFLGGFNYLDQIVRGWDLNLILTGLAYIGTLLLLNAILSLPFSVYSTFVIEEKFGFNKTTPITFVTDILKGLALSIVLGGVLLAGVLAFFHYAGDYAWFYCWIATTIFILFVQFIAPIWIMPLFNKFTPLQEGELKNKIMAYAQSVSFALKDIFVVDGSRRSKKSNAFFTGFGKNKRIALFDTLIKEHTVLELEAVLAHEIGHYKKKHILKGMIITILHMGFMFFLLSLFLYNKRLFDTFYMTTPSIYAGLIFFGLLYTPIELILSILMQIFSRKNEYEADCFAAKTIANPEEMIKALKKLSVHNLSNLTPHPFYVFLNYSHPPVLERIRVIKKYPKVTKVD